ncbi:putative ribonuclease H-like domain-containing protein [Tanacetum coccineum]
MNVIVETTETKALVSKDGLGYDWSDQAEEGPTNFAFMAYTSSSCSSSDSEVSTCSKACLKSNETLKEHYDNLKKDFNKSQLNVGAYKVGLESVEARLDMYKKNEAIVEKDIKNLKLDVMLRDNALTELRKKFEKIQVSDKLKTGVGYDSQVVDSQVFDSQVTDKYKIGEGCHAVQPPYTGNYMPLKSDLVLADEDDYVFSESVTSVLAVATSEAKTSELKPKSVSEPLIEDWISDSEDENETEFKSKQRKPSFAKVEFIKSNEHVKIPRESVEKVENNKQAKYPRKNNQSSKVAVSINTARPINTAYPRPTVNYARPASNVFNRAHSHIRRPFNKFTTNKNNNLNEKVNTVRGNVTTVGPKVVVSDNKGHEANVVKASACWGNPQLELQEKRVIDSGCSRHMTGNKSYLLDYEEINGGFVSFGGSTKGGKITGKGKIRTGKLDFKDVYFVMELKFNLFSVSQICNKKNSVLFTYTECVVLSLDFKLLDENQVLLRVPRKNNMYNVDLKNVAPLGGIENQINYRVKIIRCDNETEFKNKEMNQFCEMKGIKREFSVARIPQQNGVAKRKNRTLIEAARTMLADLKKYALSIMRPFGCPVTILNTLDHLGSGPEWLFDIDTLTKSMNYEPVVTGNQSNVIAGTKACKNAGKARVETVPSKNYILLPFLTQDPPFSSSSKDSHDAGFKPSGEEEKKDAEDSENKDREVPSTEEPRVNQDKDVNINNTNNINTVSPTVNAAGIEDNAIDENIVYGCADDPNMPNLEEIQVWTLVDLPYGTRAIEIKWIYRNKKDERGITVKNKAMLVAQGYTQEEGLNYDEVFAPVARIEAIRSKFLDRVYKVEKALYGLHQAPRAWYETLSTYLLDNGFQSGQRDKTLFIKRVKGDILLVQVYVDDIVFGSTKKVLCTEFKKLMHKKFQMSSMASTPMETSKPLMKDENAEDVDVHLYRSMIGSLMYLTSSRPDIMFGVCACARFQVILKVSHLHAVKRIFRYLKGQPKLGLWYPKDSPFDLEAYTDSDYASASLDKKSTTRGCQFLGSTLISWQCKKQIVVGNSTTEAEYVATSN